mmetsp:Transcript_11112/g.23553  ORF Transcript_11112/g.23553 Transcript_11112/m.23553 type:complete len:93 (-) Transcript_11112:1343-1621(-)
MKRLRGVLHSTTLDGKFCYPYENVRRRMALQQINKASPLADLSFLVAWTICTARVVTNFAIDNPTAARFLRPQQKEKEDCPLSTEKHYVPKV